MKPSQPHFLETNLLRHKKGSIMQKSAYSSFCNAISHVIQTAFSLGHYSVLSQTATAYNIILGFFLEKSSRIMLSKVGLGFCAAANIKRKSLTDKKALGKQFLETHLFLKRKESPFASCQDG
jgi:hypothetical protein